MTKTQKRNLKEKPPCFICGGKQGSLKPYMVGIKKILAHPVCRGRVPDSIISKFIERE